MRTMELSRFLARRDFVKIGALGAAGLTLSNYLRMVSADQLKPAKAKSAIFVFLQGGPSHLDTFDLKPNAPKETSGEFKPIKTKVPGIEICEHLPKLAACANLYTVVRGVSHSVADHKLGTQYLLTGNRPIPSMQYPSLGTVVSKELPSRSELPSFVAVPSSPETPGYLGVQYAPLQTNAAPVKGKSFSVRGIGLGEGVTTSDMKRRQRLLLDLDTALGETEKSSNLLEGLDEFSQQAYNIISSPEARLAFDTSKENPNIASRFSDSPFSQSCLLAARLVEAGVRFVTVSNGSWDTHTNNFYLLKGKLLPALDTALAGLLTTLADKGLLDSTIVYVTGEFGRTPTINPNSGRDHWPRAMNVLMAGGGIARGRLLGASDKTGAGPANEGIAPDDLAASFYQALGIDPTMEYHTSSGRPVMIVRDGKVVPQLFA